MMNENTICSGCGRVIHYYENSYSIDIYEHSDNCGGLTARGCANNILTNMNKINGTQPIYCSCCVDKIYNLLSSLKNK